MRKKNSSSEPVLNSPQLQKKITSSKKKNNRLSSDLPNSPIYIPPSIFDAIFCLSNASFQYYYMWIEIKSD
jgi:hypothetical protein